MDCFNIAPTPHTHVGKKKNSLVPKMNVRKMLENSGPPLSLIGQVFLWDWNPLDQVTSNFSFFCFFFFLMNCSNTEIQLK